MAAVAELEDLKAAKKGLDKLAHDSPNEYVAFVDFFNRHKHIGYKNIMKMMLYNKTPEGLKE